MIAFPLRLQPGLNAVTVIALALLVSISGTGVVALSGMSQSAQASPGMSLGYAPQRYKGGITYGNGVYFAPYAFKIYSQPDTTSPLIGEYRWNPQKPNMTIDRLNAIGDRTGVAANNLFFSFYPEKSVAMLAVTGDNDGGWLEVIYDQAAKKTGWVQQPDAKAKGAGEPEFLGVYQTWLEFMKLNAKASGVYWLSGVSEYNRAVRTRDDDAAKLIPLTIMRSVKVRFVRGNWLLVEVLDFEGNTPIGWVRWRDDDGSLMVFPNITQQHIPIMTGF